MKEKLLERHKVLTESIEKSKTELQQYVANLNVLEGAKREIELLLSEPEKVTVYIPEKDA